VQTPAPRADSDLGPGRLIPSGIRAFLNDRRIDPVIRTFLLGIAAKQPESWSFADFQRITAIVPSLTEMHIPTALLSEFYAFMGLDPTSLFEAQLGASWQITSTAFDPRNRRNRRCANLRILAASDPESVRLHDLLNCGDSTD
jgi:hypothetical protein